MSTPAASFTRFPILVERFVFVMFAVTLLCVYAPYPELSVFLATGVLVHVLLTRIISLRVLFLAFALFVSCMVTFLMSEHAPIPAVRIAVQTVAIVSWWLLLVLVYEIFRTEFAIYELTKVTVSSNMARTVLMTTTVQLPRVEQ